MRSALLPLIALSFVAFSAVGCKKKGEVTEPVVSEPLPMPVEEPAKEVPQHVQAMKENFERVFFDFDSSDLVDSSKTALNDNVKIMQAHNDVKLQIQGHADERGTTDYNLALGQRRADAIKNHMINQGVAPSRLAVVSYGEEKPLDPGSNERAWAQNRRAEFIITWGDAAAVGSSTDNK
jgi:peptidoglycan-associated lipoprotein